MVEFECDGEFAGGQGRGADDTGGGVEGFEEEGVGGLAGDAEVETVEDGGGEPGVLRGVGGLRGGEGGEAEEAQNGGKG